MSKRRRENGDDDEDEPASVGDTGTSDDDLFPFQAVQPPALDGNDIDRKQRCSAKHEARPPPVDDNYGIRPMFDASQLMQYDSDQEVESTDLAMAYLAQVSTERKALPALVNSKDRQAAIVQEQAEGDADKGKFHDGYYAGHPDQMNTAASPSSQDDAYIATIIQGYQAVRHTMAQPFDMGEMFELVKFGYLSPRWEEPSNEWFVDILKVILPLHQPKPLEVKWMETRTCWYFLGRPLRMHIRLYSPFHANVGLWMYYMLARVEPVQAMSAEGISDLRQLATAMVEARDAMDRELEAKTNAVQMSRGPGPAAMTGLATNTVSQTEHTPAETTIEQTAVPGVEHTEQGAQQPEATGEEQSAQPQEPQEDEEESEYQPYRDTYQVIDTILIIVGVYYRQRDLLEHRKPFPLDAEIDAASDAVEPVTNGNASTKDAGVAEEDASDEASDNGPSDDEYIPGEQVVMEDAVDEETTDEDANMEHDEA